MVRTGLKRLWFPSIRTFPTGSGHPRDLAAAAKCPPTLTADGSQELRLGLRTGVPFTVEAANTMHVHSAAQGRQAVGHWLMQQRYKTFNGVVDEVRIYRRALSAAEVQGLAGTGPPQ